MAPKETGSHESTWKQACRLMQKLNPAPADRDAVRKPFLHLADCDKLAL
jgi:hypothetical protein